MIKKVAAIQTSDGNLFLEPDDAKKHEFSWQMYTMLGFAMSNDAEDTQGIDPDARVISVNMLVEKMEPLKKAIDEATNIVERGPVG